MWLRIFYNLAFPFVLLALLPGFVTRMLRRGKYRHKFGQRFGIYSARVQERFADLSPVWIHAVSVGEVRVAMKLISAWKSEEPGLQVVLSTTTSTGFALARAELESTWLEVIYNPLDFYPCVRAALRHIQPSRIILVEAEVWPNLVWEARRLGIPAYLANARLSPRSARRFRKAKAITAPIFNQLEKICVQFPAEISLWQSLGVQPGKITLTGSVKYDFKRQGIPQREDFRRILGSAGCGPDAQVLLGASTHSGEELILAKLMDSLRQKFPDAFLILVPRHAERCGELASELRQHGHALALRSEFNEAAETGRAAPVLLVDSTGELRDWFAFATVAFIGKSITATGGQNPVEAIIAGAPAVFGPHMENFQILTDELLSAGGALQVEDGAGLERTVDALFSDPDVRQKTVQQASSVLAHHRGAASRTVAAVRASAPPQAV